MFGPSVDSKVGFLKQGDDGFAMRRKLMTEKIDNVEPANVAGFTGDLKELFVSVVMGNVIEVKDVKLAQLFVGHRVIIAVLVGSLVFSC